MRQRLNLVSGDAGQKIMAPFSIDLFKGMLAFFLLDMGLMAAKNSEGLKDKPPITLFYAIGVPLVHNSIALGLCTLLGLPSGDTVLLMALRQYYLHCYASSIKAPIFWSKFRFI